MNVVIRTDASLDIGMGHVMRCLALANVLRERGAKLLFIVREHGGHVCDAIDDLYLPVCRLPAPNANRVSDEAPAHAGWLGVSWQQDANDSLGAIKATGFEPDWMVIDHYALDDRWERVLRERAGGRIAVIDDLADRNHDCDLLIDQNCLPGYATRYDALVSNECEKLVGPRFALLRPEFRAARRTRQPPDGVIGRLLVFFGSVDVANYTSAAILALRELNWPGLEVDVVTGAANPWGAVVKGLCELEPRYGYHCQVTNMAKLMAEADLAISAGGFASYELAYMGLPSLLFPLTKIQEDVSAEMAARGAAISMGRIIQFPHDDFVSALSDLNNSPERCREMSQCGQALFDGLGAERVADVLVRGSQP